MASGIGLVPVRHKNGSPYVGKSNMYFIPATDASNIGIHEAVKLVAAMDADNQVPVVAQAAAGDALIGSIIGIVPNASVPLNRVDRPASVGCYVLVADDPDIIFQIQEDAVGGAVSAADIGAHFNADLIVTSATANASGAGVSLTMLDSDTAAATSATLKIVGVARDNTNAGAQTAGAVLEVVILEHALLAVDSIT